MKNYITRLSLVIALAIAVTSCEVARQAQGVYNMVNCKYSYRSMTGLSVAGVDPSNMSLLDTPKILNLLTGNASSIPVGFTLNLDVQNPNTTEAMLNGLEYVLAVDGVNFTSGALDRQLSVPAGGIGTLPLAMVFDVATLLKGETQETTAKMVKNLMGIGGGEASNITLNIRPSFMVAGHKVMSPAYIPIGFNVGGK